MFNINKYNETVKFILTIFVIISSVSILTFYVSRLIDRYESKIEELEFEIVYLNEYIDDLIEYIENEPEPIVKTITRTVEVVKVDSFFVKEVIDYYDINPVELVEFSITDRTSESHIRLNGYVRFEWDMNNRRYNLIGSEITDKLINLNVKAIYSIRNNNELNLQIPTNTSNINITYIENQTLDLRTVYKPDKNRWGVGVIGGVGFINEGFTPFIGVGVTYTFTELSFRR